MPLEDVFSRVRPSIVAFCSKMAKVTGEDPPLLAPIIGTGFVVHEDGVVATNRHVAEAMLDLPRDPETGGLLAMALVFGEIVHEEGGYDLRAQFVEIVQLQMISSFSTSEEIFYGEQLPDVAFAQLAVRGLPSLALAHADWSIRVGMEIATAGFPLGEDPLIIHGVLGQGTPLLRRGIVSAVSPFPCPQPDAFTIDVMSQGGASGSPIFRTDEPEVVGILFAGFPQTNITLAVPSAIVNEALKYFLREHVSSATSLPTLAELVRSGTNQTNGRSMWRRLTRGST